VDRLLALTQKQSSDRAVRDAIRQGLEQMYDISAPMPDRLVALLNQLPTPLQCAPVRTRDGKDI
jgi:hypothetical protein